jgi:hypothetical protein
LLTVSPTVSSTVRSTSLLTVSSTASSTCSATSLVIQSGSYRDIFQTTWMAYEANTPRPNAIPTVVPTRKITAMAMKIITP